MLGGLKRLFGRTPVRDEYVGDWLLNDRLHDFLNQPSSESFGKLRLLVVGDRTYRAASTDLDDVELLLEAGQAVEARARLRALSPGRLLCPRFHRLAGDAARRLGDAAAERRETMMYSRMIDAILESGDGTREHPYTVAHLGDEYDLVDYLERRPASQELLDDDGRSLERITCQDGSDLWFDLTDLYTRLDQLSRRTAPRWLARMR